MNPYSYDAPDTILKDTLKMINQDRMIFYDLPVNSQQIFMKYFKHYFSKKCQTSLIIS